MLKMVKIEQIEFKNMEEFKKAINNLLNKNEMFREYRDKDGIKKTKKIISNNRLYLNNNFSLNLTQAENEKIYLSIDYFSIENRWDLAKKRSNPESVKETFY